MAFQFTVDWGWRLIYWENLWSGIPNVHACTYNNIEYKYTDSCFANNKNRNFKNLEISNNNNRNDKKRSQYRIIGHHRKSTNRQLQDNLHRSSGEMTRILNTAISYANKYDSASIKANRIQARLMDLRTTRTVGEDLSDLKVTMYDSSGQSDGQDSEYIISFQISDDTKTKLIAYGALTDGSFNGFCRFCFHEGSYFFRLTNDRMSADAYWTFCNTRGTPLQELSFHIKDGRCFPDVVIDVKAICKKQLYSLITVESILSIDGSSSEMFSKSEAVVVSKALAAVYGWSIDDISVTLAGFNPYIRDKALSASDQQTNNNDRALAAFSYNLQVHVTFVSEVQYAVDGTSYNSLADLLQVLESEMAYDISSGELLASIRRYAYHSNVNTFTFADRISYKTFEFLDVTHIGGSTAQETENIEDSVTDEDSEQESYEGEDFESTVNSEQSTAGESMSNNTQDDELFYYTVLLLCASILGVLFAIAMTKAQDKPSDDIELGVLAAPQEKVLLPVENARPVTFIITPVPPEVRVFTTVQPTEREGHPLNFFRQEIQEIKRKVVL